MGHMSTIITDMRMKDINITYHMDFEGGPFSVGCDIEATATNSLLSLEASFCLDATCPAEVEALAIHDVTYKVNVEVNIPGHQYLTDWIINYATGLFIQPVFEDEISHTVEAELKKVFLEAL